MKQLELLCSHIYGNSALFHSALRKVECDIAVSELVDSKSAPENALYFGDKDIYIVRLFDIVISTEEYAVELVLLVCSCSKKK